MSAKLTGLVFDRYPEGGGEMLLALKLADNAHDDGTHIFPSVATMAEKTRQSERAVQYQLRRMQESGWLILVRPARGGRGCAGFPAEYRINPDWIKGAEIAPNKLSTKGAEIAPISNQERVQNEAEKGANDDRKGCKAFAPEPSVNHQEPSGSARSADAPRPPAPGKQRRPATQEPSRGTRLPDDWALTTEQLDWALKEQPTWTAKHALREASQFRDYWRGVSGHRGCSPDWPARWRTWVRRADPIKASTLAPMTSGDWWEHGPDIEAKGKELGVRPRKPDEPMPFYRVLVAKAAGKGPWIDFVLRDAQRSGSERYFEFVVDQFGDALMPTDFYA